MEEWRTAWTVITHSYADEEGVTLGEVTTFNLLMQDLSEWFGLTCRQCEELFDLGMIDFIPDTNGECFGFCVNTEEATPLKQELLPQVTHVLNGNNDSYMYSVRCLIDYDDLWEMFDWDPDEHEDCSEDNLPWDKDTQVEYELANILWQFNDLNKNQTAIDVDDIISCKEVFRGTHVVSEFLFEVPRSKFNLIQSE
ncbi:MAG: hypothetical protein VKK98_04795 [Cyanobacteriota bacterium]|nr:hypothetical protein [Cyanobacteriota bacterium]